MTVVSKHMMVPILSVSVDPHEMLWAETALAPLCVDLNQEDLLKHFLMMWHLKS